MNTIETNDVDEKNKNLTFKINTLLNHTYQKQITHSEDVDILTRDV